MKNDFQTTQHSPSSSTPGTVSGAITSTANASPVVTSSQCSADAILTPQERLISFLESTLGDLGYELVTIEIINGREKVLRVFIDKLSAKNENSGGVGIEDCVNVTHSLDLPLEANPDLELIFKGPYDLEVSSPGIDRPLRKPTDYTRFSAQIARVFTFRALLGSETLAETYSAKNPKQKNFYGIIRGFEAGQSNAQYNKGSVLLGVVPEDGTLKTKKGKKKVDLTVTLKNETLIRIPLELISKANLEPIVEGEN